MEQIWNSIKTNILDSEILRAIRSNIFESDIAIANIPLGKIVVVGIILTLALALRGLLFNIFIKWLKPITEKTETTLDDELLEIVKKPTGWLIFISGVWISRFVIGENITPELNELLIETISLISIVLIGIIIYRAAPLLGEWLETLTLHTETELDDIVVQYLPIFFRIIVIFVIVIKGAEIFLGASAGAIIGLLGGAGVALGLLFKDLIYDWLCTIIIYLDNLYRPGDSLLIKGEEGKLDVLQIGLRSTKLHISSMRCIKRIPNSKMIGGNIINTTQSATDEEILAINLKLKIDHISASQVVRIVTSLRELPQKIDLLREKNSVHFTGIEGNTRVISLRYYTKSLKTFKEALHEVNLAILEILAQEKIEHLSVALRGDSIQLNQIIPEVEVN